MKKIGKNIRHICISERGEIAILLEKDHSKRDIAKALNRSVSTISDEINRISASGCIRLWKACYPLKYISVIHTVLGRKENREYKQIYLKIHSQRK